MKCIKTDGQRINFKILIKQNSMLKINDYIEKFDQTQTQLGTSAHLRKLK